MKNSSRLRNGFVLLYASQKGNAKAIAEDLAEQCESKGLICELRCCSEIGKTFSLEETRCLVLVGSTTGETKWFDRSKWHDTPVRFCCIMKCHFALLPHGIMSVMTFLKFTLFYVLNRHNCGYIYFFLTDWFLKVYAAFHLKHPLWLTFLFSHKTKFMTCAIFISKYILHCSIILINK